MGASQSKTDQIAERPRPNGINFNFSSSTSPRAINFVESFGKNSPSIFGRKLRSSASATTKKTDLSIGNGDSSMMSKLGIATKNQKRLQPSDTSDATKVPAPSSTVGLAFSYPYPRAHSSNLLLLQQNSVVAPTSSVVQSGLRFPSNFRSNVRSNGRAIGYHQQKPIDIPSPVPSVSEPSDDNLSLEIAKNPVAPAVPTPIVRQPTEEKDLIGQQQQPRVIEEPKCAGNSSVGASVISDKTNLSPSSSSSSNEASLKQQKTPRTGGFRALADNTAARRMAESISAPAVSQPQVKAVNNGNYSRLQRPTSLLAKSCTFTNAKLSAVAAPLAESECFIVENSPAVELPPTTSKQFCDKRQIGSESESTSKLSVTSRGLQSRLKNPTAYETRQRIIYGRQPPLSSAATTGTRAGHDAWKENNGEKSINKISVNPPTIVGAIETKDVAETKAINTTIKEPNSALNATKPLGELHVRLTPTFKRELHDSGVKIDSAGSGGSGSSDANNSKTASPEGSLNRGLIDDEIRDQPDLTLGRSDCSVTDRHPSQMTTVREEMQDYVSTTDGVGPVRLRDRLRKRSSNYNRMAESCESTVSSLSIDSEDMMLDYEPLEPVACFDQETGPVGVAAESVILHNSLGRNSSRNSVGNHGSWDRKIGTLNKRASMEAVMSEWSMLRNEAERGSSQSQQRHRALSDYTSPTAPHANLTSPSSHNRIFRPPLTLECVGLSSVNLDQQTYRHIVQDVTVVKTLLLRLKRVLQESETVNPFETSLNLKNGLTKAALADLDLQKGAEDQAQITKDDLREENSALRTQIAVMRQQFEEQNRVIQCLQQQLKNYRQRALRKGESIDESTQCCDENNGNHNAQIVADTRTFRLAHDTLTSID